MNLGRVIGTVHAAHKDENCEQATLLVVQTIDAQKRPHGLPFVAVDMVGAGAGEIVFYTTAYEAIIPWKARRPELEWALIDAGIVGIVDRIDRAEAT
jgi:ethanolamine utilization protein EutN